MTMNRENSTVSLVETPGTTLRRARERCGKTIEEIAAVTRISASHIRNIEIDNYRALPAEVFIRGFLRNCAKEIDLDPEDLVEQYRLHVGSEPVPVHPVDERPAIDDDLQPLFSDRPLPRLSYLAAVIVVILGLGLALMLFGPADPEPLSDRQDIEIRVE
jgi:cytoskeletal protein RodZ